MRGLAPTSGSQVYTAWAIEGDAAPVALGDFTVGADGARDGDGHVADVATRARSSR